jgi:hypothetical protein
LRPDARISNLDECRMSRGAGGLETKAMKGIFEVRPRPITNPTDVRRRYGRADHGINGWYVVIDNGGGVDGDWQWGYGLTWLHPDPAVQPPVHSTFDQMLTPMDDAARSIVKFVKEQAG